MKEEGEFWMSKNNSLLKTVKRTLLNNLILVILFVMLLVGALFTDSFATKANLMNVIRQVSINGVLASGFTFVLLAGGFDLSLGAIVSACAVMVSGVLNQTGSIFQAVAWALFVGAVFGLLNGLLITLIRGDESDSFLVTLGTYLIASGVAYTYSGGYIIYIDTAYKAFRQIAKGTTFGIPNLVVIMLSVMIVFQFILKKTAFGRKFFMVGGNKVASYISGINSHRIITASFVISGICAGLAGIMMAARTGGAGPMVGVGAEIDASVAAIVGGTRAGRSSSSIFKTLIGVLIFGLISNIMNLMGFDSTMQKIAKGIILLIALYSDGFRKES